MCVKESDRIVVMVDGLCVNGVLVEDIEDMMIVYGIGSLLGGGMVVMYLDYCIVMFFFVVGFVV